MADPGSSNVTAVEDISVLRGYSARLAEHAARQLETGSGIRAAETLAVHHRALHHAAVRLALGRMAANGEPLCPVPFCFVLLGSGARAEQSVVSDQDHALVYDDAARGLQAPETYFLRLGEITAALLHEIGYPLCSGNVMASNARWRGSISEWKERLEAYAGYPDWDNIRFLLIALDAIGVYGENRMVDELRRFGVALVARSPFIKWRIADQGQSAKAAWTFAGIRTEPPGPQRGKLAIKDGLYTPLVSSVRLWAQSLGLDAPSTNDRIRGLLDRRAWDPELAERVRESLDAALYFRIAHHVGQANRNEPLDDYLPLERLSEDEKKRLKSALRMARQLQQLTLRHFPRPG